MFRNDQGTGRERFSFFPRYSLEVSGANGPRMKNELKRLGIRVSYDAGDLLEARQYTERPEPITVMKFHLEEIGIRNVLHGFDGWNELVEEIRREGIDLCPIMTAPDFVKLYPGATQADEQVTVLSQPITWPTANNTYVFQTYHMSHDDPSEGIYYGQLALGARYFDDVWYPDDAVIGRIR